MADVVPDSADEGTPILGLPGLQATPGGAFLSPEIGPVPLFSPPSDASTHFSPASAGAGLQPAAAAAISQPFFSSEDEAASDSRNKKTPDVGRLAIEHCISLVSQSPAASPGPSLALPALPGSLGPLLAASGTVATPGSTPSAAAGNSASAPACALRWPAGSYGLDSDGGDSDGNDPAVPEGCSQQRAELDVLPSKGQSSDLTRPVRAQRSERWPEQKPPTEPVGSRRAAATDYRRVCERGNRRTRSQQRSGDNHRFSERERRRADCVGREDGCSESRRQLSLLSRLRQLLSRVKNQLDDDGENITAARLREIKNRMRPCSASLEALMNGHMSKDVSRRLAKVQEVSNTLVLRMKMLEARCQSSRKESSQTHIRPTAGGRSIRKRGHDQRQTAHDRRKKAPSPDLPSRNPPTPESSPPCPPSPGSPLVPSADEANTSNGIYAHAAPAAENRPSVAAAFPTVSTIPAAMPSAATATLPAPMGGAMSVPPAGGGGPWFWQWPMGYPAWPPQPPWFGPMPWDHQTPTAVPATAPPPPPPPPAASVQAMGSQPPVEPPHNATKKLEELSVPHRSTGQAQEASASDCGRDTQSACAEEMKTTGCRSLLLRLKTVRLIDDCELLRLSRDCWDRPEMLLECVDGSWD